MCLLSFLAIQSEGQTSTIVKYPFQTLGNKKNHVKVLGMFSVDSVLKLPKYKSPSVDTGLIAYWNGYVTYKDSTGTWYDLGRKIDLIDSVKKKAGTDSVFYYRNGVGYLSFVDGSSGSGWNVLGNSGTNPATDGIGTTDAQPLRIITNNTERARVLSGGNVGIGTSAPDSTFQVNGGLKFVTGRQAAGEILMSDAGGGADWVMPTNGLTGTATSLKIGGLLVENTTINARNYFARIDSATSMRFMKYRSADTTRSILNFPSGSTIGFNLSTEDDANGLGGYKAGIQSEPLGDGVDIVFYCGQGTSSIRETFKLQSEKNSFIFITDSVLAPNLSLLTSISDTTANKPLVIGSDNVIRRFNYWPSGSGSGVDSIWRTPGIDSIKFSIGGINYAIKDSVGSGGGSSPTVGTYSTRIGSSPSDGTEFFQTDIGRDAPDGKYYYLNSKWHYMPLNDESLSTFWNEFHTINSNNTISDDGMIFWSGNSGTISYTNTTRPGVARFATSTTTNGYSGFYTGAINNPASWINLPNGTSYFKASININTLSTAGERYAFRIGLANGMLGDFTSGVYLEYDESQSANWRIKSANFGTRTTTTSGTAVATGWQTVELLVNSGGTSVEFWVDGTSLGTITTNIPGAGNGIGPAMIVQKSAGTTSRYIDVDYLKSWQRLNTDRN